MAVSWLNREEDVTEKEVNALQKVDSCSLARNMSVICKRQTILKKQRVESVSK